MGLLNYLAIKLFSSSLPLFAPLPLLYIPSSPHFLIFLSLYFPFFLLEGGGEVKKRLVTGRLQGPGTCSDLLNSDKQPRARA